MDTLCLVYEVLGIKHKAICTSGKQSINGAISLAQETILRSVAHADARAHVKVHGPCCHQKSCGSPRSILQLAVKGKEVTFSVVLMTADSW